MDSTTYLNLKNDALNQIRRHIEKCVQAGKDPVAVGDFLCPVTSDANTEIKQELGRVLLSVMNDPEAAKQHPGIRDWLMKSAKDLQESLACEDLHIEQAKDPDFSQLG